MKPAELFDGVRRGDDHSGGIRCLRLFRLEPSYFARVVADVTRLCGEREYSSVHEPGHISHWTRPVGNVLQYSLLNRSGQSEDYTEDHDLTSLGKRFHQEESYPALGAFIGAFAHLVNFRVNVLAPGAALSAHEEHVLVRSGAGTVGARLRFHLPIVTEARAELTLDGAVYHLEAGTVYFVNHGCVHAASNRGKRPRIHCAWDALLTRTVFDQLFGEGPYPDGLERVADEERVPEPVRTERMGAFRRLPPPIGAVESSALSFMDPQ